MKNKFGQQLCELKEKYGWTNSLLADKLDDIARNIIDSEYPTQDERYRVLDSSLITRWEKGKRHPTAFYVICLIKLFQRDLDLIEALAWAKQAKKTPSQEDILALYPEILAPPPPAQPHLTLSRLDAILPLHQLFGIKEKQANLEKVILDTTDHWILSIEGIGGIGKTSLASYVVKELFKTNRFYDIVWISAKQNQFTPFEGLTASNQPVFRVDTFVDAILEELGPPQLLANPTIRKLNTLTYWFKTTPYLVVIDNLETVEDYESLMPLLRHLTQPTKFLLTSRKQVNEDVYTCKLDQLNQADAISFIKYMSKKQTLSVLSKATNTQLNKIYEVVGGNPLALKLVIGLSTQFSLPQILTSLKEAKGKIVDDFYTYIYWQAWHTLSQEGKEALLSMPLIKNGTFTQWVAASGLTEDQLNQAIKQLTLFSLVEIGGTPEQYRYRIHRLTETFLLKEVLKWQANIENSQAIFDITV